jgi:hypothetical protein
MGVHACHPRYLRRINGGSSGQPRHKARPDLKTNQSEKDWGHGLRGRMPASQVQGPKFQSYYQQDKKERKKIS